MYVHHLVHQEFIMKKIMILNGSPRRTGNTAALIEAFARGAQVYADEKERAVFAWNGYSEIRPVKV